MDLPPWGPLKGEEAAASLTVMTRAAKTGLQYRWSFDFRNPEFREWVKLSIPLMLGVSLVSADDWILRYFASGGAGRRSAYGLGPAWRRRRRAADGEPADG